MKLLFPLIMAAVLLIADKSYQNPVLNKNCPDPTVIHTEDGWFYLISTESHHQLPIYKSHNLVDWTFAASAFTREERPHFVHHGAIWAPDINYINGKYVLYYAMSTWGGEWEAGIGVAVSDAPAGPYHEAKKLLSSKEIGIKNCIDPFFIHDNGRNYLFWGSFSGIYGMELTNDGTALMSGSKPVQVAGTFMEATYIHKHGDYYYLFGSAGTCCNGERSTYRITVGRSKDLFGPYVDRRGKRLLDNNYELVLHKGNGFVGPGHNAEIITDKVGNDWMLYHSYKTDNPSDGRVLLMDQIIWYDGWPAVERKEPSRKHSEPIF